ncbi:Alpha-crystallin domain-containing protein 22.3 [Linum perenne]
MTTPGRSSVKREHNQPEPINPEPINPEQVYDVPPLNAVPLNYFDPFVADDAGADDAGAGNGDPPVEQESEEEEPSMVFFPTGTTESEYVNILNRNSSAIVLSGASAMQKITPGVGQMNIGESDEFYNFSISLPGVAANDGSFKCEVDPSGLVEIEGVTTTGGQVVEKPPQVFFMESQNLCPPGPFTMKFRLPGPVVPENFRSNFADGMFEGIVKKLN